MPFVIGEWRIDPVSLRFSNGKKTVKLEPRAMAVLDYLACRPDTVVSRQELEDAVWVDRVVGYDALSNAILKLRKALGDNARDPHVIETIAKTGFRLIVEVRLEVAEGQPGTEAKDPVDNGVLTNDARVSTAQSTHGPRGYRRYGNLSIAILVVLATGIAAWWQPWVLTTESDPDPLSAKPSIAVLPFVNRSHDTEWLYYVDGMRDDLITDISKISGLFVIAGNSVDSIYAGGDLPVSEVAEKLRVQYLLKGSVRRVGKQVRINVQLIDATTDGHLWAERYDGPLQEIIPFQDQVFRKIVSALKINLTDEEAALQARHSTDNAEAHDAFLQGWALYKLSSASDLARSIPYFEEALRLDPGYADAHAMLAAVYWDALEDNWAFELGIPSFEAEDRASRHLQAALKTPNLMAHAQQSRVYLSQGLLAEALREAERAVAIDPNSAAAHAALANTLILNNRPGEGLDVIQKAMKLDPYHPPEYLDILGTAQFGLERFEAAATSFDRAFKRNPDSESSLIYLASSYGYLGDLRKAEATIATANELRAANSLSALSLEGHIIAECRMPASTIDFSRFGPKWVRDRLRGGLSKIPVLNWANLDPGTTGGVSGKAFDSAMGEWNFRFEGPDCILNSGKLTFIDGTKATYPYRNGRILFHTIGDHGKWEGYWIEESSVGFDCAGEKDGSTEWGTVIFQFNEAYTLWKGEFDFCGEGRKYPFDGHRL